MQRAHLNDAFMRLLSRTFIPLSSYYHLKPSTSEIILEAMTDGLVKELEILDAYLVGLW